ncbi:histidine phosphatase family protein [Paenibacillus tarimensis]
MGKAGIRMSLVTLVRHGVTSWNLERRTQGHANNPLDPIGIAQAKALAERLSKEEWDVLYASDLMRARQTAETVAETIGLDIIFDQRLREIGRGKLEGTTEEERIRIWGNNWRELDLNEEHPEFVAARGAGCIEEISNIHPNKKILVISHGELMRLTLNKIIPDFNKQDGFGNTSVTQIRKAGGGWECVLYNCTDHLGKPVE